MKRETIVSLRIKELEKKHEKYDFARFLYLLRNAFRLTREVVSDETGISETRLFCLETGRYLKNFRTKEIAILSAYYGINRVLLFDKAVKYFETDREQKTA